MDIDLPEIPPIVHEGCTNGRGMFKMHAEDTASPCTMTRSGSTCTGDEVALVRDTAVLNTTMVFKLNDPMVRIPIYKLPIPPEMAIGCTKIQTNREGWCKMFKDTPDPMDTYKWSELTEFDPATYGTMALVPDTWNANKQRSAQLYLEFTPTTLHARTETVRVYCAMIDALYDSSFWWHDVTAPFSWEVNLEGGTACSSISTKHDTSLAGYPSLTQQY